MTTIKEYEKSKIIVGGSLNNLMSLIPKDNSGVVIITDTNVGALYSDNFPKVPVITIGIGEGIKTQRTANQIINELITIGADRHTFLIGIGGGVVCDITGYVASIFMRGVRFGYVPTSLLAQIDASVGGKTGVNFKGFKNIIGAFSQPDFVLCDFTVLNTLPPDEIKNGLVEAIKHGIISSPSLFEFIEKNIEKAIDLDRGVIEYIITNSIRIKTHIVNSDEFEIGVRKTLNLGHTYGHAIESISKIPHGRAVGIGLVYASKLSQQHSFCSSRITERISGLLEKMELETSSKLRTKRIVNHLSKDKKRFNNELDFVFIKNIGQVEIARVPILSLLNFELS